MAIAVLIAITDQTSQGLLLVQRCDAGEVDQCVQTVGASATDNLVAAAPLRATQSAKSATGLHDRTGGRSTETFPFVQTVCIPKRRNENVSSTG